MELKIMCKDICIVVQGPSNYIEELNNTWKLYKNVVYSTWKNNFLNSCDLIDNIIYQDVPDNCGIRNLNLQKISTYNGIEFAKQNGYDRVLKIRSDMMPTNIDKFLNLFYDKNNFYVFSWINHEQGYYTDYFMCGDIKAMEYVWNFDGTKNYNYPEQIITEKIKCLNKNIVECYNYMCDENDLYWIKYGKMLKKTFNKY